MKLFYINVLFFCVCHFCKTGLAQTQYVLVHIVKEKISASPPDIRIICTYLGSLRKLISRGISHWRNSDLASSTCHIAKKFSGKYVEFCRRGNSFSIYLVSVLVQPLTISVHSLGPFRRESCPSFLSLQTKPG